MSNSQIKSIVLVVCDVRVEYVPPSFKINHFQAKLQERVQNKLRDSWSCCWFIEPRQNDFTLPVFSRKTKYQCSDTLDIHLFSTNDFRIFPKIKILLIEFFFQSTENIYKKQQIFLKPSHCITARDASRPRRVVLDCE